MEEQAGPLQQLLEPHPHNSNHAQIQSIPGLFSLLEKNRPGNKAISGSALHIIVDTAHMHGNPQCISTLHSGSASSLWNRTGMSLALSEPQFSQFFLLMHRPPSTTTTVCVMSQYALNIIMLTQ